jgi:hypothetical protein
VSTIFCKVFQMQPILDEGDGGCKVAMMARQ